MRRSRFFFALLLSLAFLLRASRASASDDPSLEKWTPFMPVFGAGTALFLAGYVPVFAAAAPTSFRLVARFFYEFGSAGLGCAVSDTPAGVDHDQWYASHVSSPYLCTGDFGAAQLLVPIAGPFLYAANHPHDSAINASGLSVSTTMRTLLYVDGVVQATGMGLMIAGLIAGHRESDRMYEREARAPFSPASFSLWPIVSPTRVGLGVTVTAW